jgi:hypothetical protein
VNAGFHAPRLIAFLGFLLPVSTAGAQQWIRWVRPGGDVRSLAVDPKDPQRLYLGTAEGVLYRSDVGGQSWQRLTPGFPRRGQSLDSIVVSPTGTLLVGYWDLRGAGGGVAISTNRGQTFTIAAGLAGESIRSLALSPSDARVAVAGARSGIFASRDGGSSWARISPEGHLSSRDIESLAFDPRDSRVIYVGTWHLAWKTSDGGTTWKPLHGGMNRRLGRVHPDRRPSRSRGVSLPPPARVSIARRTAPRAGPTCAGSRRAAGARGPLPRTVCDPKSSTRERPRGLWVSEDDAETWRLATSRSVVVNALLTLPDGTLLVGSEGAGVLRSQDRARSWAYAQRGFLGALRVAPSSSTRAARGYWSGFGATASTEECSPAPTTRGPWTDGASGSRAARSSL